MCYNGGMSSIIGVVLFIIGTLGAFVSATAWIAYLKTMTAYMGLKKFYRALFSIGILTIATLTSVLMALLLISGQAAGSADGAAALTQPATETSANDSLAAVDTDANDDLVAVEVETEDAEVTEVTEDVAVTEPQTLSLSADTGIYNGHEYAYVEVENGMPYVYLPNNRGTFWYDLNNIASGRESGNILIMANAGIFNNDTSPRGTLVQNGNVLMAGSDAGIANTMVVDSEGNVGYTSKAISGDTVVYTDALTGETVSGRKIVSAVTAFSPIVINSEAATEYKSEVANYADYRARSIFCVRDKGSYTLISNKGEGIDGGGWNFDDMAAVSMQRGCRFAFNMDGGGSTALAWRDSLSSNFSTYVTTERHDPTFIVFTADNLAPSGK